LWFRRFGIVPFFVKRKMENRVTAYGLSVNEMYSHFRSVSRLPRNGLRDLSKDSGS
jgi:hypothetical protein